MELLARQVDLREGELGDLRAALAAIDGGRMHAGPFWAVQGRMQGHAGPPPPTSNQHMHVVIAAS
jgi:hypothetical protein